MNRTVLLALAASGSLLTFSTAAFGASGFASGGASAGRGGGSPAGSHASARGAAAGGRSSMASGRAATHSSFARGASPGFRFTSGSAVRHADPYRFFSPYSVVPCSRGGFVAAGWNGRCLPSQAFCWNGRNCFLPWGWNARWFGGSWVGLGGSWWPSDDDPTSRHHEHRETTVAAAPEPVMIPIPVVSTQATPTPPAEPAPGANSAPVSREFAYGAIVTEVQGRLAREGFFRGSIDGYLTAGTRTAIAMFQDRHQLVITGRIDAALLDALSLKP